MEVVTKKNSTVNYQLYANPKFKWYTQMQQDTNEVYVFVQSDSNGALGE
jgi:hypothetical protein